MAFDDVTNRLYRLSATLNAADVPDAVAGGQAVAMWVATQDPAAVRTTKNIDILLRREDLSAARRAPDLGKRKGKTAVCCACSNDR